MIDKELNNLKHLKILINQDKNSMIIRGTWQYLPIDITMDEEDTKGNPQIKEVKFLDKEPIDYKYFIDALSKLDNSDTITIYIETTVPVFLIAILQKIIKETNIKVKFNYLDKKLKEFLDNFFMVQNLEGSEELKDFNLDKGLDFLNLDSLDKDQKKSIKEKLLNNQNKNNLFSLEILSKINFNYKGK